MNGSMIGRNILVIDKYFKLYLRNSLKNHNLNTAEGMVLLTLFDRENVVKAQKAETNIGINFGMAQEQIIDELHYDKGVMTRTLQPLEKKGYVIRTSNPNDSRSYIFSLTKKASDFKPTLIGILREWSNIILEGMDYAVLSKLNDNLDYIAKNAAENHKVVRKNI